LNLTLHDDEFLELLGHCCLLGIEILLILLLEGLLELFDLVADLIALEIRQPLLVAFGKAVGELADAIFFQRVGRDLGDGLTNASLIGLG